MCLVNKFDEMEADFSFLSMDVLPFPIRSEPILDDHKSL
jgi:hypothetical protein